MAAALACMPASASAIEVTFGDSLSTSLDPSYAVSIPFRNPLQDHDANLLAWRSTTQLVTYGVDALSGRAGFHDTFWGRTLHGSMLYYFNFAGFYYSHETAHQIHNRRDNQHFWVDMSDWQNWVPTFVFNNVWDVTGTNDIRELIEVQATGGDEHRRWNVLMGGAGLYQNEFNSRLVVHICERRGETTISNAFSYWLNKYIQPFYIYRSGNDPAGIIVEGDMEFYDHNDINGYIFDMGALGIDISRDEWLVASGAVFALSAQTWNTLHSMFDYALHGSRSTGNLGFGVGGNTYISPPDFYLYPTNRGLYAESEFFIGRDDPLSRRLFVTIGTGLDSFGADRTGPVDRVRMGGGLYAVHLRHDRFDIGISPWIDLDFTRDWRQIGHAAGAWIEAGYGGRLSLSARIEHSRNDVMEQVIKDRENGFDVLLAVGAAW